MILKLKNYFQKNINGETLEIDICPTEEHLDKYLDYHFNDNFEPTKDSIYHSTINLPKNCILLKLSDKNVDHLTTRINFNFAQLLWNKKIFWANSRYFEEVI